MVWVRGVRERERDRDRDAIAEYLIDTSPHESRFARAYSYYLRLTNNPGTQN